MTGKPGWFQAWAKNNPELVEQILTVLKDPAIGKTYVSRNVIVRELQERGIQIDTRLLTGIVSSHPELFEQWSGKRNSRCIAWRRVEA